MTLPTDPEYYVTNSNGTIYHVINIPRWNEGEGLYTLCGYEFPWDSDIPNVVPKRTKLVCKRCLLSLGIDKRGQYDER